MGGLGEGAKGAIQQLRYGMSRHDILYGDKLPMTAEFTDYMGNLANALASRSPAEVARFVTGLPGRTHAAIKEFVTQPEFARSMILRGQHMRKSLIGAGKSAQEADAFMSRPSTQSLLGTRAYMDSLEAKFQGKNAVTDAFNNFLVHLDKNGGTGGRLLSFALKSLLPIRGVPVNIAKEITSYTFGGAKAAWAALGKGDMTPERADYIMKNIKKNGALNILFAVGYLGYGTMFGGTYQTGDYKKKLAVRPGEANIGGLNIGTEGFDGAAAQVLQMGAGYRRLFDSYYGKSHNSIDAGLHSIADNFTSIMSRQVPYIDQARRLHQTFQYGRNGRGAGAGGLFFGNMARSMVIP
jgi:hypothetical protein